MILTLKNINTIYKTKNPIIKSRVFGHNTINEYRLETDLTIELSNKQVICIEKGYVWDLASVPRFLWWLMPPDSDAEIAFLIHDYLYENRIISKEFADKEMLIWSIVLNGRKLLSLRNIDNSLRYYAVKWFGRKAWNT